MDPTNAIEVRRYDIVGAFPKKLEFGQMRPATPASSPRS